MNEIILYVNDSIFCLTNPPPELEKEVLTIKVKELKKEEGGWQTKVVARTLKLFEVKKKSPRIITGDHGHVWEIIEFLKNGKFSFQLVEDRIEFPEPRLDLMFGFRFSQKELLTEALTAGVSGCIEAPTRYGKTTLMVNTLRAYPGVKTIVMAPGADLVGQLYRDLKEKLPDREIVQIGGDSKTRYQSDDITVCSSDSIDKCDPATPLILADEPHTTVTDSRLPELQKFTTARKLAYGASYTGRFDNKDKLITGLFGKMLARRTFKEAVAEGAICNIEVIAIPIDIGKTFIPIRSVAMKKLLYQNPTISGNIEYLLEKVVPQEWQSLIFIKNEAQADYLANFLTCQPPIAMAKKLTKKKRGEFMESMASGDFKRCLASDIYSQGVTFSDLRVVINASGGGPYTNAIQKPGRLAEIRPNKKVGVMVDFIFTSSYGSNFKNAAYMLVHDSISRLKVYYEKGYSVNIVGNKDKLTELFNTFI